MTNKTRGWLAIVVVFAVWLGMWWLGGELGIPMNARHAFSAMIGFVGGFFIYENFHPRQ